MRRCGPGNLIVPPPSYVIDRQLEWRAVQIFDSLHLWDLFGSEVTEKKKRQMNVDIRSSTPAQYRMQFARPSAQRALGCPVRP
jgi:hypothetical protein